MSAAQAILARRNIQTELQAARVAAERAQASTEESKGELDRAVTALALADEAHGACESVRRMMEDDG